MKYLILSSEPIWPHIYAEPYSLMLFQPHPVSRERQTKYIANKTGRRSLILAFWKQAWRVFTLSLTLFMPFSHLNLPSEKYRGWEKVICLTDKQKPIFIKLKLLKENQKEVWKNLNAHFLIFLMLYSLSLA